MFLPCSFWLADNLGLLGPHRRGPGAVRAARSALRNDVGLLAEEYDPASGRMLGNFPQAFTHVSLVNTAGNLSSATRPALHRATGEDGLGRQAGDDPRAGGGGDEQVVEAAGDDPPQVHRDVHHDLLELLVGELAAAQRGLEVLGGLVVDAELGAAADAHQPAVAAGEVLVARPHLAVEVVEVGPAPERGRRRRRAATPWTVGVGGLAPGPAHVVVDRVGPRARTRGAASPRRAPRRSSPWR